MKFASKIYVEEAMIDTIKGTANYVGKPVGYYGLARGAAKNLPATLSKVVGAASRFVPAMGRAAGMVAGVSEPLAAVAGPVGWTIAAGTAGGGAASYLGDKYLKNQAANNVTNNAMGTNTAVYNQLQNPNSKFTPQQLSTLQKTMVPTQFQNPQKHQKMQQAINARMNPVRATAPPQVPQPQPTPPPPVVQSQ